MMPGCVNCRLSLRDLHDLDALVEDGTFRNRSDAIRSLVTESLVRIRLEKEYENRYKGYRRG